MKDARPAGSQTAGGPAFLSIGRIRRPHGVRGEMLMEILTDFPERLKAGVTVHVGENRKPVVLRSCRPHAGGLLIAFEGVQTPEAAAAYRNRMLYVPAADLPDLAGGMYYHHRLIGCRVVTEDARDLGVLTEVLETGANDVFVARSDAGREVLLPVIDSVIRKVDIESGCITVHLLPGLLDDGQGSDGPD